MEQTLFEGVDGIKTQGMKLGHSDKNKMSEENDVLMKTGQT